MGFLDKLRGKGGLKDKAVDLAKEHDDKLDQGIDKASELADKATKGKYTDKIEGAAEKAKSAYEDPQEGPGAQTPPPPTPPVTDAPDTPPAPPQTPPTPPTSQQ